MVLILRMEKDEQVSGNLNVSYQHLATTNCDICS